MAAPPRIAVDFDSLVALADRASREPRIALDLEANGRFAYRARVSTIQLAFADEVALVDPIAPGISGELAPLARLFSSEGPIKVIHDVGFDARLLAEVGLRLGNVHDTALLAQWLGRPSTGLASLALHELGVTLDKSLQAQDWAKRPLNEESLKYLADDVGHLLGLDDLLWAEAVAAGIVEEVLEETAYRLASAERSVAQPDPRPPFARIKGADALDALSLAVLRQVAMARDAEAERMDNPAGELIPTAVLLAVARVKPRTRADLARVKSPMARLEADRVADALVLAVARGLADGRLSAEDARWFERTKLSGVAVKARRDREARLSAWRKAEAVRRAVHEQVVLPGHCAAELVESQPVDLEAMRRVGGLGGFRVERYGPAILDALREPTGS